MPASSVPEPTKRLLWGLAAGRCQYEGCNRELWRDDLTKAKFNTAYIAHIIAEKPGGPRGDPELSEKLKACISNLMLLCDPCHTRIDIEDVPGHPVERLRAMKAAHERRVEIATGISVDKNSHILLYGPNIGAKNSPLSYTHAAEAMLPIRYPATGEAIRLSMVDSELRDDASHFWTVEEQNLVRKFARRVEQGLADGSIQHLSVFAIAPQPLLIRLGTLVTDLTPAEVYQLHRESCTWRWPSGAEAREFRVEEPSSTNGPPALILSLSATVQGDRIKSALDETPSCWRVTIEQPYHDVIQSPKHLETFRRQGRALLDRIKAVHGERETLHVFPAMPVSTAVELGRIRQPKADLPWRVYDQNSKLGGFAPALDIG